VLGLKPAALFLPGNASSAPRIRSWVEARGTPIAL